MKLKYLSKAIGTEHKSSIDAIVNSMHCQVWVDVYHAIWIKVNEVTNDPIEFIENHIVDEVFESLIRKARN